MLWLITLLCLAWQKVESQQCLALSLEGGGSKGAYEAGVLYSLASSTSGVNFKWNAVTGISIGSVNSGLVSQYPMGQELPMANYMLNFWRSLNGSSSIWVDWPGGYASGLLFHPGLVNNAPAVELAKTWLPKPPQRNITVGSTNLDLGDFGNFNESLGMAIIDAITASASIPFMFPPKIFEGYAWADGACIMNLDVFSAVQRCLAVTPNQKDISIDMIFAGPITPLKNETSFKTPDVLSRIYEIHSWDQSTWYSYNAMKAYPNVNYRHSIIPSQAVPGMLNFTKEAIEFDIQLGIKDGQNALKEQRSSQEIVQELYKKAREIIIG